MPEFIDRVQQGYKSLTGEDLSTARIEDFLRAQNVAYPKDTWFVDGQEAEFFQYNPVTNQW